MKTTHGLRRHAVALIILSAALTSCGDTTRRLPVASRHASEQQRSVLAGAPAQVQRPNIVFILTDDLSSNLLPFMPHVRALEAQGMTWRDYFVSDSLCCPSRASIFTGKLPHNTGVLENYGADGGIAAFNRHGDQRSTFALTLQRSGYRTALMGKYLNGYLGQPGHAGDGARTNVPATYVPPGWSEWAVAGFGYPEFNYTLNQNGVLHRYGGEPRDYLTDVIARLGSGFIDRTTQAHRPLFLELATFAPHSPNAAAPRDRGTFPGLMAPRPASFNQRPADAPRWLAGHRPLSRRDSERIDRTFRRRVRSVQAVDSMVGAIEQRLQADHVADNTYVVFSSDNGFHTGEYRLLPGKQTAFDTDIRVPLLVVGPGVAPGSTTRLLAENIDLAETFAAIAGRTLPGDGHSLLPALHGGRIGPWRRAVLIEHRGPDEWGGDPDFQPSGAGDPRSYEALRAEDFLYVEYHDGEREYYDLRRDPFELHNVFRHLSAQRRARLHAGLDAMRSCHGASRCWRAVQL